MRDSFWFIPLSRGSQRYYSASSLLLVLFFFSLSLAWPLALEIALSSRSNTCTNASVLSVLRFLIFFFFFFSFVTDETAHFFRSLVFVFVRFFFFWLILATIDIYYNISLYFSILFYYLLTLEDFRVYVKEEKLKLLSDYFALIYYNYLCEWIERIKNFTTNYFEFSSYREMLNHLER